MVTLFSWNGLYESINLGYDAIKVASYDCASFPFIGEIKKAGIKFLYPREQHLIMRLKKLLIF